MSEMFHSCYKSVNYSFRTKGQAFLAIAEESVSEHCSLVP